MYEVALGANIGRRKLGFVTDFRIHEGEAL
jgi:hypothetical protein